MLKGLSLLHLTLWLLTDVCCTKQRFFYSVCQAVLWVKQAKKVYQQCWREWEGCCS